ncbi:MAG: alpha/beta hydrolase [Mycobacteriaceae bacterium]|nr:alpha/beta hydrolase [Mycobacteriaceae bacterium]
MVLLHGLCLTQDSWAMQIRQLTHRWGGAVRIISHDHRGHGRFAGAPSHTYRVERLAADLADVLQTLRVTGPLTLAGHSLGGMTALAYLSRPAAQRPVEPENLVLIAAAAGRISERGLGRVLPGPPRASCSTSPPACRTGRASEPSGHSSDRCMPSWPGARAGTSRTPALPRWQPSPPAPCRHWLRRPSCAISATTTYGDA